MKKLIKQFFKLFKAEDIENNSFEHKVKIDGISACTTDIRDAGQRLTVYGWTHDHWKYNVGDNVLIVQDKQESRYKIKEIEYPWNVSDVYFLRCIFNPRIV